MHREMSQSPGEQLRTLLYEAPGAARPADRKQKGGARAGVGVCVPWGQSFRFVRWESWKGLLQKMLQILNT